MIDGMPSAGFVPEYPWLAFWHAAMQIRIHGIVVAGFLVGATSQAQSKPSNLDLIIVCRSRIVDQALVVHTRLFTK